MPEQFTDFLNSASGFWQIVLGLLLGWFVNLTTPLLRDRWGAWSDRWTRKQIADLEKDLATTERWAAAPGLLTNYLIVRTTALAIMSALLIMLMLDIEITSARARVVAELTQVPFEIDWPSRFFSVVAVLLLAFVVGRAGKYRDLVDRMDNLDAYGQKTNARIQSLRSKLPTTLIP